MARVGNLTQVFVYGVCAGPSGKFERFTKVSLAKVAASSPVVVKRDQASIHQAYNEILDEVAHLPDVEGLVLLHDDIEMHDTRVEDVLRDVLADSAVGVVGVIGGSGHVAMPYWELEPSLRGGATDNQQGRMDFGRGTHVVDTVDGILMVLSPAALRVVRFDERSYPKSFHGYDADICSQARAAGLKVVTADVEVHHHNNPTSWYGDQLTYTITDLTWQLKWRTLSLAGRSRMRAKRARLLARRWRRDRRVAV